MGLGNYRLPAGLFLLRSSRTRARAVRQLRSTQNIVQRSTMEHAPVELLADEIKMETNDSVCAGHGQLGLMAVNIVRERL